MHIILLTTFFPPDAHSGIGRYVEDLALGFVKNGHEVEVIAIGKKNYVEVSRNGFLVHWILNENKWIPSFSPFLHLLVGAYLCRSKLIEVHKKNPVDVVEYPNTGITCLISLLFKFPEPRPKFIIRLSSPRSIFKKRFNFFRITELLESLQACLSDAVIAVSQANYSLCQESYKFSTKIPYRVILHALPVGADPYFAEPLSKSDNILRVFFLGRMEDRKGFDILAKAWPMVVTAVRHTKLIVAGEDLPQKGEQSYFRWAIRDASEQVLKQIEYLGNVDDKTRESLYQHCDVCVVPSRYESFGLTALEAMRYGKPVVSSNVGGIPEVIKNGVTGLLVPVEDHNALAQALIKLLKFHGLREILGKNALEDIKARFQHERVVAETETFYFSL